VVGHDDDASGGRDERPVGRGLDEVRRRQAGHRVDAVYSKDERVDVQRAQRCVRHRPGQGVRRSAHTAGEDDGQVVALGAVQQLGHAGRVRHGGQVGDVEQQVRHGVRRGPG